ncbi:DUF3006 domain-containing protein [Lysinibacillus sp. 2017]|uniref:DUF3006 domain-containing protein n=1 Tax=Lysinibacillus sp. 2017 TaxID=2169540 RepID=UPI001F46C60E|nr:DUF3006 domain-containing protein [Lysinibacillus sp. 2017]
MRKGKWLVSYHNYTLDRFDGEYAIFLKRPEETEQLLIHRSDIVVPVKEGDIVRIEDNGITYNMNVLHEETNAQKARIQQLMKQLREKK